MIKNATAAIFGLNSHSYFCLPIPSPSILPIPSLPPLQSFLFPHSLSILRFSSLPPLSVLPIPSLEMYATLLIQLYDIVTPLVFIRRERNNYIWLDTGYIFG